MGIVTVRCPTTGTRGPTGDVVGPDVFDVAKFGPPACVCDACGELHAWEKPEVSVQLDGAPVKLALAGLSPAAVCEILALLG